MPGSEILTRVRTSRDRNGDPLTPAQLDIPGCTVWPVGVSTELTFQQDSTLADYHVLAPPDTDLTAADQAQWRGLTYDVVGTPQIYTTPFSSLDPGLSFLIRRATG